MRTSIASTLFGGLILITLLNIGLPAKAAPVAGEGNPMAGTYYGLFDLGGGVYLPFIANVGADGTFVTADGTDEGLGGFTKSDSPAIGRWTRTGATQGTGETIAIGYDSATGQPTSVTRETAVVNFNSTQFQLGAGTNTTRFYDLTLGDDPLDPDGGTITGVFQFSVGRVY